MTSDLKRLAQELADKWSWSYHEDGYHRRHFNQLLEALKLVHNEAVEAAAEIVCPQYRTSGTSREICAEEIKKLRISDEGAG